MRSGRLISVPYTLELNDVYVYNVFHYTPEEYGRMIREQFDVLYAEGGRVMCTAIHPHLVNQPHRQRPYVEAIEYILGYDDVWVTTGAGSRAGTTTATTTGRPPPWPVPRDRRSTGPGPRRPHPTGCHDPAATARPGSAVDASSCFVPKDVSIRTIPRV